jgi:hydroxymethylpyrimidine/phosphomethylpyrimidine kinase
VEHSFVIRLAAVQPPIGLSIAGSDSGGGAGIQADLRTFAAFGVHGTTVVTAITAQNTLGVHDVHVVPTSVVESQLSAVVSDLSPIAVKTGMLATPEVVERVASWAARGALPNLVVDPVVVSTTGHLLLGEGGVEAYRKYLLPQALIVTPNLTEACALASWPVDQLNSIDDVTALAFELQRYGSRYVLVKGGHFTAMQGHSPDVLVGGKEVVVFDKPRIVTSNDHGTGCSLSAAIAAGLSNGRDVVRATSDAIAFVSAGLEGAASWHLGSGRGPIDHLGWNA